MKLLLLTCLVAYAAATYKVEDIVSNAKLHYALYFQSEFPVAQLSNMQLPNMQDFDAFMTKFSKTYATAEEKQQHFIVFSVNALISQALQHDDQGTAQYGVTKFSDMSVEEFNLQYRTYRGQAFNRSNANIELAPKIQAPTSVDWRKKGAVSKVKNQQQCGSCWAFSTTGNVEGQWAIKKGQLLSLSESQLVDCDNNDAGCNGGLMDNAFRYIVSAGGLMSEADYPYVARDESCKFDKSKVVATISGHVDIASNEEEMATWCAANGPISIGINANNMQFYNGGVAHPSRSQCNPEALDHGVLIVGYGVDGDKPFWIVKNSWGPEWGEEGYYRCYRGSNVCGLKNQPSSSKI